MDYHEILISGFGGQGVMAIGKTLAEAGMYERLNVSWLSPRASPVRKKEAS